MAPAWFSQTRLGWEWVTIHFIAQTSRPLSMKRGFATNNDTGTVGAEQKMVPGMLVSVFTLGVGHGGQELIHEGQGGIPQGRGHC